MPTITISIPDDLKTLLDEYKHAVNVSGVCQGALRRKLELARTMGEKTMELTERLRAELDAQEDSVRDDGVQHGIRWAQGSGNLETLEMLKNGDEPRWRFLRDKADIEDRFKQAEHHEYHYDTFVAGFAEGAIEAYDEAVGEL